MKHTFLALSFAALASLAAAQEKEKKDPRVELARVIAVEEQERDLKKAETLYREAIADTALSAEARALANRRLGHVLQKLGREAEAKPFLEAGGTDKGAIATIDDVTVGQQQDLEREKALREKARELVKEVLEHNTDVYLDITEQPSRSQLIWIGDPAIPEIAAALAAEKPDRPVNPTDPRDRAVAGLAGVLWHFGGPAAESHLEALLRDGDVLLRARLVQFASQLRERRMQRLAERWLQQENDEDVALRLLSSGGNHPLCPRLDADVVLTDAARRSPRMQVWVLGAVSPPSVASLSATALAKAHGLVRAFLAGTDPELGQAAQRFLGTQLSQQSPEGVELLIQQLPHLQEGTVAVAQRELPVQWLVARPWAGGPVVEMRREAAAALWPQLVACARVLPVGSTYRGWLRSRLERCAGPLDAAIVPDLLSLIEGGDARLVPLLGGKVNLGNATAVFALYDRLDRDAQYQLLDALGRSDLPAEMFESLRECAAARMAADANDKATGFVWLIARTGNPDAAAWMLDHASADKSEDFAITCMIELGRRSRGEKVRAALRTAVGTVKGNDSRSRILLALLAMTDEPALQLVAEHLAAAVPVVHPYAKTPTPEPAPRPGGRSRPDALSPVEYLLYANPDPPHGFAEEAIVAAIPAIATKLREKPSNFSLGLGPWRVSDRVLVAAVVAGVHRTLAASGDTTDWPWALANRIAQEAPTGPLHRWLDETLRTRGPGVNVVLHLKADEIARIRPQLDALLSGDDADLARLALNCLANAEQPLDLELLLQSKHENVCEGALELALAREVLSTDAAMRELAKREGWRATIVNYLGSRFAVEAVPALVALLKDPSEEVRKAAAEALTKIRFYHEQQAHWDRVLKGLDASPASAAEKLLLQAKPGAPRAQRLLAITSLGTLGVPEALPFLIDWTQDADAEVAKKATEAITQIHLNPRK